MTTAAASHPAPTSRKVASVTAIAGGAALIVKVALILATAGTLPANVQGALYLAGLLLLVIAAAAAGVHLARDRGVVVQILAAVGLVLATALYVTMLSDAVKSLVAPFTDTAYVLDETPIALLGVVWAAIGVRLGRRRS